MSPRQPQSRSQKGHRLPLPHKGCQRPSADTGCHTHMMSPISTHPPSENVRKTDRHQQRRPKKCQTLPRKGSQSPTAPTKDVTYLPSTQRMSHVHTPTQAVTDSCLKRLPHTTATIHTHTKRAKPPEDAKYPCSPRHSLI